jgi:hypothetical protein
LITLLKTALDTAARRDKWAESTYSRKRSHIEGDFDKESVRHSRTYSVDFRRE